MASGDDNNNQKGDEAPPKPSLRQRMATSCHNFGTFMYNPKDHTVMGRTGTSWAAILLYYLGFYAVLAAFWAACLAAFMHTIDYSQPTQQHKYSMLKDNPGMTYEPMPSKDNTLISFNFSDPDSYKNYTDRLDQILQPYFDLVNNFTSDPSAYPDVKVCNPDNKEQSNLNYVCLFNVSAFIPEECSKSNNYGFKKGKPCIFLRPNKIFAYQPQSYPVNSDPSWNSSLDNPPINLAVDTASNIVVSCDGETPVDKDNLLDVTFYPPTGFPFYFYPYLAQPNYMPPFVMAQFNVIHGRAMMIWCRNWAKGIKQDRTDVQGGIHFELLVDPPVKVVINS